MTEQDELEPELRALLRRAGAHSAMPADAPERLFSKVSATIGIGVGVAGAGAAASAAGHASAASSAAGAAGKVATLVKLSTLAIFASGAAVGALGHASYVHLAAAPAPVTTTELASVPQGTTAPNPQVLATSPPVESPSAAASASSNSSNSSNQTPSAARSDHPAPSASTASSGSRGDDASDPDQSLAAERADLEIARTAIGRGQAASALAELDKHAQRFPRGRLSDERDSLRIQALMLAGRIPEAKQRLAEFRKRRPKSLFLPALEAALGE